MCEPTWLRVPRARFGTYELHDLLALKAGGCGVLVSIAKDSCKVLLNKARALTAPPPESQLAHVPALKIPQFD